MECLLRLTTSELPKGGRNGVKIACSNRQSIFSILLGTVAGSVAGPGSCFENRSFSRTNNLAGNVQWNR